MRIEKVNKYIIWVMMIALFLLMHVYRIGDLPYGIQCDEMGMGYDAWCLANFGTDRYQNSFPVYLINFSGGQSALYAYLCAPFVYFWGFSATVFRIPAIICSIATAFFILKIIEMIYPQNKKIKLFVFFLYTIFPIFTMIFRTGLDCILMLGGSTAFIYSLIRATNKQRYRDFLIAGIVGGITLYTYALSHLVLPLFLLFAVGYLLYLKKIQWKQLFAFGVPLFILAFPLILFHIINMFDLEEIQLGFLTIPKLYRYRSDDISMQDIKNNIGLFFKYTLLYDGVENIGIERFATMYHISIPFIMLGFANCCIKGIQSIRKRVLDYRVFILFWFMAMFCMGILLSSGGPQAYRMNALYMTYLVFCVDGIQSVYAFIKSKKTFLAQVFMVVITSLYSILFVLFAKYYFCDYTEDTYLLDYYNFKLNDALDYLEGQPNDIGYRTTYIGDVSFTYIYYLGSSELSPQEYNKLEDDEPYTLYLWTQSYQNYRFYFPEEIDPTGNYILPETSQEYINLCVEYGLKGEHIGQYYVFTNPWLEYKGESSQCIFSWDHGVNQEGTIVLDGPDVTVLSGWALDSSYGKVWDDIIFDIDGTYYVAEKTQRSDVAEIMSNEDLIECGFHITLDTDIIENAESVQVIFINYNDNSCCVQKLQK